MTFDSALPEDAVLADSGCTNAGAGVPAVVCPLREKEILASLQCNPASCMQVHDGKV